MIIKNFKIRHCIIRVISNNKFQKKKKKKVITHHPHHIHMCSTKPPKPTHTNRPNIFASTNHYPNKSQGQNSNFNPLLLTCPHHFSSATLVKKLLSQPSPSERKKVPFPLFLSHIYIFPFLSLSLSFSLYFFPCFSSVSCSVFFPRFFSLFFLRTPFNGAGFKGPSAHKTRRRR